jgi:26S proteasome regulatory subunit T4
MNNRDALIEKYIKVHQTHDKQEEELKNIRMKKMEKMTEHTKTEDQLKAIQSVGMLIGEILNKQSDQKFLVKVLLSFPVLPSLSL